MFNVLIIICNFKLSVYNIILTILYFYSDYDIQIYLIKVII